LLPLIEEAEPDPPGTGRSLRRPDVTRRQRLQTRIHWVVPWVAYPIERHERTADHDDATRRRRLAEGADRMLSAPVATREPAVATRNPRAEKLWHRANPRSPAASKPSAVSFAAPVALAPSRVAPSTGRCRCGGTPGPTGECAQCRAARLGSAGSGSAVQQRYQGGTPPAAPAQAAAPVSPLSTPTITGGVTGNTHDVRVTFSSCGDCHDGLEAIQVAWATGGPATVGKQQTRFPPFAAVYDTFVDGGKVSPGGLTYTGNHPYYIGRASLPAAYGYSGRGPFGSANGCTCNPQDQPTAIYSWDQVFFETAVICLKHLGGSDKLLNSWSWGFVNKGATQQPDVYSGGKTGLVHRSTPTAAFLSTLAGDYPGYSYTV
jgi:hypothetical protein